MIKMQKSQSSMEFVILVSFMMLVFALFFIVIQQRAAIANEEKNDAAADNVKNLALNEIKLAESVSDNYYREFSLPNNLNGLDYNISIMQGVGGSSEIVIKYANKEKVYYLEGFINSASTLGSGLNSITKSGNVVLIKHISP